MRRWRAACVPAGRGRRSRPMPNCRCWPCTARDAAADAARHRPAAEDQVADVAAAAGGGRAGRARCRAAMRSSWAGRWPSSWASAWAIRSRCWCRGWRRRARRSAAARVHRRRHASRPASGPRRHAGLRRTAPTCRRWRRQAEARRRCACDSPMRCRRPRCDAGGARGARRRRRDWCATGPRIMPATSAPSASRRP